MSVQTSYNINIYTYTSAHWIGLLPLVGLNKRIIEMLLFGLLRLGNEKRQKKWIKHWHCLETQNLSLRTNSKSHKEDSLLMCNPIHQSIHSTGFSVHNPCCWEGIFLLSAWLNKRRIVTLVSQTLQWLTINHRESFFLVKGLMNENLNGQLTQSPKFDLATDANWPLWIDLDMW